MNGNLVRQTPRLVIAEGKDEHDLVKAILQEMNARNDADIWVADGETNLSDAVAAAVKGTGPELRVLALVRDAEDNAAARVQSSQGIFRRVGFPVPDAAFEVASVATRRSAFAILPPTEESGAVESMCLRSVREPRALACADAMFACVDALGLPRPQNPMRAAKLRCLAYMTAVAHDWVPTRCGAAILRGQFDLTNEQFAPLRNMLTGVLE